MSVAMASFFLLDSTLSADQKTVVATKGIEWLKWASVAPFIWLSVGSIAFFAFLAVASWSGSRAAERMAYYKNEMLRKVAESPESGAAVLEYLREQQRDAARKRRDGMQLGGLITAATGIGIMIFLKAMVHIHPVYLVGLIPLLIGLALFGYAHFLMREPSANGNSVRQISA